MWAGEEDRELELLEQLECGHPGVVRSIVEEQNRVLPPVRPLLVQRPGQAVEEELHGLCIGVLLNEAEVDPPGCVQAEDHGDPGLQRQLWHRVGRMLWPPLHPPEVTHPEPGLVNVDDHLLALEQLEET